MVEVDASDGGFVAVLYQMLAEDHKLHPCAFFTHKLSPPERMDDIGDRELLAVKTFIVWTDHTNLKYIRSAKRLNPQQARWSLFFSLFDISLSYQPGSRMLTLMRFPGTSPTLSTQLRRTPPHCHLGAVTWNIKGVVRAAQSSASSSSTLQFDAMRPSSDNLSGGLQCRRI